MKQLLFIVAIIWLLSVLAQRLGMAGVVEYDRHKLEAERAAGRRVKKLVFGVVDIADDVTPELAQETIESLHVVGVFRASEPVRDALAGRVAFTTAVDQI